MTASSRYFINQLKDKKEYIHIHSFDGMSCGKQSIQRLGIRDNYTYFSSEIVYIEITTLEQYLELKEQEFEFSGQSYLFWEYVRIKKELEKYNSDLIFLLENVRMTKKWSSMFDEAVGNESVFINSALVSTQNRQRLYWNPKGEHIKQPKDKEIYIKDILEYDLDDESYFAGRRAS